MPRLQIDRREIEVEGGATLLEAARKLGIRIPTLCHSEGHEPHASCMACAVRDRRSGQLLPSCAARAQDGMDLESETEEVRRARREALELLLSDHLGDCLSPCQRICPAHLNIPLLIRQVRDGRVPEALGTIHRDLPLPSVACRACHRPCEAGCRRGDHDAPVSIARLVQHVIEVAAGTGLAPAAPLRRLARVGIVGAGVTGLSAADFLLRHGYACALFDERDRAGGSLRADPSVRSGILEALDEDIRRLGALGVEFRLGQRLERADDLEALRAEFDAILVAAGGTAGAADGPFGLPAGPQGLLVNRETFETGLRGVFAAGHAVRRTGRTVHALADGKAAAFALALYLCGQPVLARPRPFSSHLGKLMPGEIEVFMQDASGPTRHSPESGPDGSFTPAEAVQESLRCLHCDCRRAETCKLRKLSQIYGAGQGVFRFERGRVERRLDHPFVIHEPGKCIRCGSCIRVAEAAREALGLTFIGRGFNVRVGVPFNRSLAEGLRSTAAECAAACPTGALVLREEAAQPEKKRP
ncbi:MAG: (2Fe-2S)-binding protein [Planctomycetes bacterium]|nr:(2Fe-2S)-binding protein [Planctomycetota bacterium]